MRRITLMVVSTIAVLVLLFSYRTSLGDSGTSAAQAVAPARVVSTGAAASTTSTGQGPDPTTADGQPDQITVPTTTVDQTATGKRGTPPVVATTVTTTAASSSAAPTTTATQASAGLTATVDGASELTRYGAVQVHVVIADGKITDVVALQYPQRERLDVEINEQAIPILHDEVIAAQSANVDGVSGATYTTDGYLTSLQSALDAAGFQS